MPLIIEDNDLSANLLIVDDEQMIRDLLCITLTRENYTCFPCSNADEGLEMIKDLEIDLALLDVMMPGSSGLELLKELKKISPDTAVLMITALSDMETALSSIHLGADDYITKPFSVDNVVMKANNALEKRRLILENRKYQNELEVKVLEQTRVIRAAMEEINLSYESTLSALVRSLDARESEVGSHSERVMNYTLLLARHMGISEPDLSIIAKGALLHDIGKIGVSDNILLKPGKLTDDEWIEMKKHPQIGHDILSDIKFLKGASEFILAHHERFDGKGYPNGLKGTDIPLSARIFALVDTLDAMTSDRPYRKALPYATMVEEIKRCRGSQFDPAIVDEFLAIKREQWEEVAGHLFI
jgi:putative nucleotidyltransferase with HDIG domain